MIGRVKGKLIELDGNVGLIETSSGLSYEVFLTASALSKNKLNSPLQLYTFLQIRDDAHVLFGFETKGEQNLFKLLTGVSGVGPKTAFGIVSFSKEEELLTAVRENNVSYFERVPGLGKKTAMKIVLELSQKLDSEFEMKKMYLSEDDKMVVDALVSLGIKTQEAKKIFQKLPAKLSIEEKIREGLRLIAPDKKKV